MSKRNEAELKLHDVLRGLKNNNKLTVSTIDMTKNKVLYANFVTKCLSANGIIDHAGRLIKDFSVDVMIEKVKDFSRTYNKIQYDRLYKSKKMPVTQELADKISSDKNPVPVVAEKPAIATIPILASQSQAIEIEWDLADVPDAELTGELRKRGYDVKATKVIEI